MTTTGERVEQERTALGWSQGKLAEKIKNLGYPKIHQTTIDKLEKRGTQRPRYSRELAIALGVTHEWLLTGKGSKPPAKKDKSLDQKMGFLESDDFDRLYDAFEAIIDNTLQKSQPK